MKRIEQRPGHQSVLRISILITLMVIFFGQAAVAQAQWATNGSNINTTNTGNVGIGTTAPAAKLQVTTSGYGTYTDVSGTNVTVGGSLIDQTVSANTFTGAFRASAIKTKVDLTVNLSTRVLGLYAEIGVPNTNSTDLSNLTIRGSNNVAYHGGSGALGNMDGFFGTVLRDGSGAVTTVTGVQTVIQNNNAAGAITNVYGFKVAPLVNIGTITNTYGVYVANITAGTQTKAYSFYAADPSAGNYFGGQVAIGVANPAATAKLDVAGQIYSRSGGIMFPDETVQATASVGTISGVTAGAGLTGGGTSGTVTLGISAGTGLTVAPDSVSVKYGSAAGTAVQGNTLVTVSPGAGMSGGGQLTLGAGGTLTLTNNDRGSTLPIFKSVANAQGATQFSAGTPNDAILFEGTGGTTVTFSSTSKKITINTPTAGSTISAANVSEGQFGSSTGGGDYSFPANVGVSGNMTVTGNLAAKYQDVAEWVPSRQKLSTGTVVVLDTERSNHVIASASAYDTRVAGVVSAQPGVILGEGGEGKVMVATTGRVKVKVDARHAPVRIGDLLVTSDVEGVAMKSEPIIVAGRPLHAPGTLIGKALEPLDNGVGEILVLLSMQ